MRNRKNGFILSLIILIAAVPAFFIAGLALESETSPDLLIHNMLTPTLNPTILTPRPYTLTPSHTPAITPTPTASATREPTPELDLNDYQIFYLAAEDVLHGNSLISSESLFRDVAITPISEAQILDSATYPDVLVIHVSAEEWLDQGYIAQAVRQGVILVTIDVPLDDRADWMDSDCMLAAVDYGPLVGQYEYTAFITWIQVTATDPTDALRMADYIINYDCAYSGEITYTPPPMQIIDGPFFRHGSSAIMGIESLEDAEQFREALEITIRNRENAIQTFQRRFLAATPTSTG